MHAQISQNRKHVSYSVFFRTPMKIIFYTRKSSKKHFPNFSCMNKNGISEDKRNVGGREF
jgi:hypothetical protein